MPTDRPESTRSLSFLKNVVLSQTTIRNNLDKAPSVSLRPCHDVIACRAGGCLAFIRNRCDQPHHPTSCLPSIWFGLMWTCLVDFGRASSLIGRLRTINCQTLPPAECPARRDGHRVALQGFARRRQMLRSQASKPPSNLNKLCRSSSY